jgi:tetratricopeptide (TPR) repeat protein
MRASLLFKICLCALPLWPSNGWAVSGPSKSAQLKTQKKAQLLDYAWSLRKESLAKRMAFTESLFSDLDQGKAAPGQRARMTLAAALVFLEEDETRLAAVEWVTRAAKIAPLQLNSAAAQFLWKEFFKRMDKNSAAGTGALADVAMALSDSLAPGTIASHTYYLALARMSDPRVALSLFSKIEIGSEFYRQAKLHEGLIQVAKNEIPVAKKALEVVISLDATDAEKDTGTTEQQIVDLKERAILNLARLHFESKEFKEAITLYRSIDAESPLFYESLTEQGWAFFMAGHPNRALGVGYGATSPHFNRQFQPDQYYLSAAVNYWLCDFTAARENIQDFVLHTRDEATQLRRWSDYRTAPAVTRSSYEMKMYSIVEDMFQGVSSRNNLLGPRSLQSLGRKNSIHQALTERADLRKARLQIERQALPAKTKRNLVDAMMAREKKEQLRIGKLAMTHVDVMRSEYERALNQVRLIHLEIMTAEKDRLMNNGRSVQGQQFLGSEQEFLESVGTAPRIWKDKKREFWKDELDSFVFNKQSQCKQLEGEERQHATK